MSLIKKFPFHPLIFAPYPVLAFAATNINWVPKLKFYWALAAAFMIMLVTLSFTWLLIRDIRKAAAITTLILLLFFTYGHVFDFFTKNSNPTLWLTVLWFLILIGASWWILSRSHTIHGITYTLNRISLLLLLFPLITLGVDYIQDTVEESKVQNTRGNPALENRLLYEPPSELPDIYFIILDGYARADTLANVYSYDNQPLLDDLKDRGFYIAEESFANYHHTALSLSTTLNMNYIKDLLSEEGIKSYDYWRIVDHVHNNGVLNLASDAGYQLVLFRSGHVVSEIHRVDHRMQPEFIPVTGTASDPLARNRFNLEFFDINLLETTALRPLLPSMLKNLPEDPAYEKHRQYILYTFSNLSAFTQEEGSYFVFAHILAPHPPFVFNATGEPIRNWRPYSVADGSHWVGGIGPREEYIASYRDQIQYINALLIKSIDEILTRSETPPVIIIQSDHGPGAYFEWQSLNQTNLHERMTILNAFYFPDGDEGWLYPSITPVNTFPVVFNRYLGQNFELSEDRAYFSKWGKPFEFTEVTEQLLEPTVP